MKSLEEVRAEVEKISADYSDNGRLPGVEPGIFDLVVALRYCGFKTVGSCEGHYHPEETLYPWVTLKATNCPSPLILYPEDQVLAAKPVAEKWVEESNRLRHALGFFNSPHRRKPRDEVLELESDMYGGTIMPVSAKLLDHMPRELISSTQAEQILTRYRRCVKNFAEYLTSDFLATEQRMLEREAREGRP